MLLAAVLACGTMAVAGGCAFKQVDGSSSTSIESTGETESNSEKSSSDDASDDGNSSEDFSSGDSGDNGSESGDSSEQQKQKYTVVFRNEDGTILQSSEYEEGETPVYNGEMPEKAGDAQYSYIFAGWGKIESVTGEATYTAIYTQATNKYTVKFVNADGTELQSSEVEYGAVPAYNGETPVKADEDYIYYTFAGWDDEIVAVTGEAIYTAAYTSENFSITVTEKLSLKPEETARITVEQSHEKSFAVTYKSNNESVATVDADGSATGVAKGTITITVECGNQTRDVKVVVDNPPAIDGQIDTIYGADYMQYTMQWGAYKDRGTADVFTYTYAGEEAVYMLLDVVGPSTVGEAGKLAGSGVVMMVKNATTGAGKYMRAYTNGCIRSCPLSAVIDNNNGYSNATNWQDPEKNPCPWFANNVIGASDYYSQYTMEFRFDYADFGVSNANELSFALGWLSNDAWECIYGLDGTCFFANRVSESDATANYVNTAIGTNTWWTYESIVAKKADTKAIRLDGLVDSKYTNSIVYTAANSENAEDITTTKLYWYDDTEGEALFLAFEVTCTGPKTINNKKWENTPGNAGVVFAVAKTDTTSGFTGTWMRAYATNISYKSVTSDMANFYSCTNIFTNYVRGNQGALAKASRSDAVTSYVIEIRLDYADYGVKSGNELSILLGGIHDVKADGTTSDWQLWHYNRIDGTAYEFETGDATAAGQVTNTSSDYYWTLADLEAKMKEQNSTDE